MKLILWIGKIENFYILKKMFSCDEQNNKILHIMLKEEI